MVIETILILTEVQRNADEITSMPYMQLGTMVKLKIAFRNHICDINIDELTMPIFHLKLHVIG